MPARSCPSVGSRTAYCLHAVLQIPITALCCVWMLDRRLIREQWLSIVLLTAGVALVQMSGGAHHNEVDHAGEDASSDVIADAQNQMIGFAAVVGASVFSGIASVYLEKCLKSNTPTTQSESSTASSGPKPEMSSSRALWIRNVQLALVSLVIGSFIYYGEAAEADAGTSSFFSGYTPMVWIVILLQIAGGLLVALVIRYTDNIAKTFATSCSIVLSFALSIAFFDYHLNLATVVGSAATLYSTWLFGRSPCLPASRYRKRSECPNLTIQSSLPNNAVQCTPQPRKTAGGQQQEPSGQKKNTTRSSKNEVRRVSAQGLPVYTPPPSYQERPSCLIYIEDQGPNSSTFQPADYFGIEPRIRKSSIAFA